MNPLIIYLVLSCVLFVSGQSETSSSSVGIQSSEVDPESETSSSSVGTGIQSSEVDPESETSSSSVETGETVISGETGEIDSRSQQNSSVISGETNQIDFGSDAIVSSCCVSSTDCVCGIEVTFQIKTKFKQELINEIEAFFRTQPQLSNVIDKLLVLFIESVNETTKGTLAIDGSPNFAPWFKKNINDWSQYPLWANTSIDGNITHINMCEYTEQWYLDQNNCIKPRETLYAGEEVTPWIIYFSACISFISVVVIYAISISKYLKAQKIEKDLKDVCKEDSELSEAELTLLKHPHNTQFRQQTLDIWEPKMTTGWAMGCLLIISMLMLPFGVIFMISSYNVAEVTYRYDDLPNCALGSARERICTINIPIPREMKAPVYVYYKLGNFYQNYRRYVKSRSDPQSKGETYADYIKSAEDKCFPSTHYTEENYDSHNKTFVDENGNVDATVTPPVGKFLYPCGLVAQSMFTDSFYNPCLTKPDQNICDVLEENDWNGTGIAWLSDKEDVRFIEKDLDAEETDYSIHGRKMPSIKDENYLVWMRTATLPTFTKLYRKIEDTTIPAASTLELTISNSFPSQKWDGTKSIVLSTTSWIGGRNHFLGIAYITVGMTCFMLAVFVYFKSDV